jgi:hypothetical protein
MPVQQLTIASHEFAFPPPSVGQRVRDRRWAARHHRMTSQLAELYLIRTLLADASMIIGAGWIQNGWFTYRDDKGGQRLVGSHNLGQITGRPLTGACLVGAIVHAGGGPAAAHTQPVHRALDLTWHALFGVEPYPVGHCPAPALRVARTRDLTLWNDRPRRRAEDILTLLGAADRMAAASIEELRLAPDGPSSHHRTEDQCCARNAG